MLVVVVLVVVDVTVVVVVVATVVVVVVVKVVTMVSVLAMGLAHNASRGVEVQEISYHFPSLARICMQSWPPSALLG